MLILPNRIERLAFFAVFCVAKELTRGGVSGVGARGAVGLRSCATGVARS